METNKQSKTKRSSVQRMFDNIMDMPVKERNELLMKMEGIAIDERLSKKNKSKCRHLDDYDKEIDTHVAQFGKLVGLSSGIEVVDDMTMGLAPGELTIVAGPTSAFKTGLCLNMAANIAQQGRGVGFITLEMTKPEIGARLRKIMDDSSYTQFIMVNEADEMGPEDVEPFVQSAIDMAGIDILFVDHLHYFARNLENQATELGMITQEFKKIAIRYNIPVVLISHTRKTDNDGKEREATMNDLRGSSFIAQDADIVLMVNKVRGEGGTFMSDRTAITLNKNRNRYGVPIMTSWHMRRNGLRIDGRLNSDEKSVWDLNKR